MANIQAPERPQGALNQGVSRGSPALSQGSSGQASSGHSWGPRGSHGHAALSDDGTRLRSTSMSYSDADTGHFSDSGLGATHAADERRLFGQSPGVRDVEPHDRRGRPPGPEHRLTHINFKYTKTGSQRRPMVRFFGLPRNMKTLLSSG